MSVHEDEGYSHWTDLPDILTNLREEVNTFIFLLRRHLSFIAAIECIHRDKRPEAKDTVDDKSIKIKHAKFAAILEISIIIDCKSTA